MKKKQLQNSEYIEARGRVTLALAAVDGKEKRPTFSIAAYDGRPMDAGWYHPLIIDLAGVRADPPIPVLLNHDHASIVGQADDVTITTNSLRLKGHMTGGEEPSQHVLAHAKDGFQWSASVGMLVERYEAIDVDASVKVNGRNWDGPLIVIGQARLGEVSIVPVGACEGAQTAVKAAGNGGINMNFEEWLAADGVDKTALSDTELKAKQQEYDWLNRNKEFIVTSAPSEPQGANAELDAPTAPATATISLSETGKTIIKHMRAEAADEQQRQAGILQACGSEYAQLASEAIRDGWTTDATKLRVLEARGAKAQRVAAVHTCERTVNASVLECALRLGSSEPSKITEAAYDESVLEAAHPMRRMGLRDFVSAGMSLDGVQPPAPYNREFAAWVKASMSSRSLPGILGNTLNKMMLDAYRAVPSAALQVATPLMAKDFKTHEALRLGGQHVMLELGNGGELKHGTLEESGHDYKVKTFGREIGITRQDWINDDLGALTQVPLLFGRGARLAIESTFWDLVTANTGDFFGVANGNYISGADSALGVVGMGNAVQALLEQTDAEGNPVLLSNSGYLVVPPALNSVGMELWASPWLIATALAESASTRDASKNIFEGQWKPLVVPALKAATAEWYIFASPDEVGAFGIAFLNGVDAPTIEEVPAPSNMLGYVWRGYIDFGVCQLDHRGAVKSNGS